MKLALCQTPPIHGMDAALDHVADCVKNAAEQGSDAVLFPEMMIGGYNIGASSIAALADRHNEARDALSRIAQRHHVAVIAGLALPGQPRPLNAALCLDAKGQELARYAKTHLFGDVDAGQFTAGPIAPPVFDLCGLRVGLAICYDIEFPELARDLALRGAEAILVPTANMAPYDSVPQRLVPARAEENALYVAYANYVGAEGTFTYGGLSCICGPDGHDIARAERDKTMLIADLDTDTVRSMRTHARHLHDRRADLYPLINTFNRT